MFTLCNYLWYLHKLNKIRKNENIWGRGRGHGRAFVTLPKNIIWILILNFRLNRGIALYSPPVMVIGPLWLPIFFHHQGKLLVQRGPMQIKFLVLRSGGEGAKCGALFDLSYCVAHTGRHMMGLAGLLVNCFFFSLHFLYFKALNIVVVFRFRIHHLPHWLRVSFMVTNFFLFFSHLKRRGAGVPPPVLGWWDYEKSCLAHFPKKEICLNLLKPIML